MHGLGQRTTGFRGDGIVADLAWNFNNIASFHLCKTTLILCVHDNANGLRPAQRIHNVQSDAVVAAGSPEGVCMADCSRVHGRVSFAFELHI